MAKYRNTLVAALSDGEISLVESQDLYSLRLNLGLAEVDVSKAATGVQTTAYRSLFNRIIASGRINEADRQALASYCDVLGLSEGEGQALVRAVGLDFFRLRFYCAKQDGQITPEEEAELAQLASYLALSADDIAEYRNEIDRIKHLCCLRSGRLPSITSGRT